MEFTAILFIIIFTVVIAVIASLLIACIPFALDAAEGIEDNRVCVRAETLDHQLLRSRNEKKVSQGSVSP